jgi:FkbM family methyltransferase
MDRVLRAWRERARRLAESLGVDAELARVYELFNRGARRDRIDNEHLRLLLAFSLSADSNCIDVGSHRGEVLREMVRLAPLGKHIAYEPVPASHAQLVSDFPGVDVRQAAASNVNGEAEFTLVRDLTSYSGLLERKYPRAVDLEKITVRTETLDSGLAADYVPRLIKIDVEGAERLVLEGAVATLRRNRPIVWFEHGAGGSERYGTRPADVHRLLTDVGMRIFDADGKGPYSEAAFDAMFHEPMWNFVAHA